MNVRELVEILEGIDMDQELEVWIYTIDELYGCGFERMTKHDVAVRNGRVEIS